MKKLLLFLFVGVPVGVVVSVGLVLYCAAMVSFWVFYSYWREVVNNFFPKENTKEPQTIWEKHIERIEQNKNLN
jgi:hypothetical protein